jgi:hypothetical protein
MTTSRAAFLAASAFSLAACASSGGPIVGRPPIPPEVPSEYVHFADAVVGKGDMAPDFTLPSTEAFDDVTLSALRGRPVVLVFASHT